MTSGAWSFWFLFEPKQRTFRSWQAWNTPRPASLAWCMMKSAPALISDSVASFAAPTSSKLPV